MSDALIVSLIVMGLSFIAMFIIAKTGKAVVYYSALDYFLNVISVVFIGFGLLFAMGSPISDVQTFSWVAVFVGCLLSSICLIQSIRHSRSIQNGILMQILKTAGSGLSVVVLLLPVFTALTKTQEEKVRDNEWFHDVFGRFRRDYSSPWEKFGLFILSFITFVFIMIYEMVETMINGRYFYELNEMSLADSNSFLKKNAIVVGLLAVCFSGLLVWVTMKEIPESINIATVNYENVSNVAGDTPTGDNEIGKVRGVRSSEVLESVSIAGSHFSFDAVNAFDNDMSTSWQPKQPVGGWIEMIMTKKQNYRISIVNGFAWNHQQLGSLYYNNNRVASIMVEYGENYSLSKKIDLLADNQTYQDIGTYHTDRSRITVLSVYWGVRWKDTAISEIKVEPIK